eukprot:SAG25_NODE_66_length_17563_cov_34.737918_4_plen_305_part_00
MATGKHGVVSTKEATSTRVAADLLSKTANPSVAGAPGAPGLIGEMADATNAATNLKTMLTNMSLSTGRPAVRKATTAEAEAFKRMGMKVGSKSYVAMSFDNCGWKRRETVDREARGGAPARKPGYYQTILIFFQEWTEPELRALGITGLSTEAKPFDEVFSTPSDFLPSDADYELLDATGNSFAQPASQWAPHIAEIMNNNATTDSEGEWEDEGELERKRAREVQVQHSAGQTALLLELAMSSEQGTGDEEQEQEEQEERAAMRRTVYEDNNVIHVPAIEGDLNSSNKVSASAYYAVGRYLYLS